MSYRKLEPLDPAEFPAHLHKQVMHWNWLAEIDEKSRCEALDPGFDENKFREARSKLLRAKAALLRAKSKMLRSQAERLRKNARETKRDFWKEVVKQVLQVGASLAFLVYQLNALGWDTASIVFVVGGAMFVCVCLIYLLRSGRV